MDEYGAQGEAFGFTGLIANTLDPQLIYEHFTYIAGIAAIAPWLYVIFIAFRIAQESADGLSGKAALAEALGDSSKSVLMFITYGAGGLLVFALLLTLGEIFQGIGSEQKIHDELLKLRATVMADAEVQRAWYDQALDWFVNVATAPFAALVYAMYQFLSIAYVFISRLIDVLFALGLAITYAWGFIAIPTQANKGNFNLMPGFAKTILTFGVWVMLEPLLLFFLWILNLGAVEWIVDTYAGREMDTMAITVWHGFAALMMALVLLMKILAPFLALALAQNSSMVGALGAAPAALGAMVANQVVRQVANASSPMGGMMPNSEGSRTRDRAAQGVGDFMNTPVSELLGGRGSNNDLTSQDLSGAGGPAEGMGTEPQGGGPLSPSDPGSGSSSPGGTSDVTAGGADNSAPDVSGEAEGGASTSTGSVDSGAQAGESSDLASSEGTDTAPRSGE